MRVPLHTVYRLTPIAFGKSADFLLYIVTPMNGLSLIILFLGCRVEKFHMDVDAVDTHVPHPSRVSLAY